ncbi:MAG: UDP-glucose 4-epimerase GalE [Bacteroidota bacterium]|nr:UDP-glucose 4-epimerase GalE [Bacteroidota bacterium]
MKILVTGGTGFIGSHTVVELQKQKFEVLIADNLSNSSIDVLDNIAGITGVLPDFEKVDLSEREATAGLFNRHPDIKAIIHFAASKSVGESVDFPLKYYRNNLNSLINILEEMTKHEIHDIVFSSSCTVYGQADELPVRETTPIKPAWSPYGNTKQICEEIIRDNGRVSKIQASMLRYFNPIGAHESALIGELPLGVPNNLIPYITQTAIGIRDYLRVWGDDYNTPDGTAIRDYIHVVDLAEAHIAAINRLLDGKNEVPVEVFNLGTGKGYSVLEVIHSFEKMSGVKLKYKIQNRRPGDIEKVWADTTRANKVLGWVAKRGLDDMTLSAWNWEKHLAELKNKGK